jgi:catechol 2,3-dioxygenase-like lactoylglutathione lyase family enzyme
VTGLNHSTASEQPTLRVERVQTGVRIERRLLKVLKALAELFEISLGDLLEGIVLHAFEGKSPFDQETQRRITTLKEVYGLDYDASYSHRLLEDRERAEADGPSFRPEHAAVVSLRGEDVPALVNFYRDVVGLPMLAHHHHAPAFDLGRGLTLVIVQGRPASAGEPRGSRFPVLAFSVKDLAVAIEQLERHDIDLPYGIEAGATTRWVKFYDPAGNLIEFVRFDLPTSS